MIAMSHIHHFIARSSATSPPLVLLHGSGATSMNSSPLRLMWPRDHRSLRIRGGIPFDDGYAFFHRFPDRSIDEADIASRTVILADFIGAASTQYKLSRAPIAIGFSNGAIIAAALLLTRPGLLAGAVLFRPLSPFRA